MTTGCTCGTPGCGGIAHEAGGWCPRCQIEALPPGAGRTLRQLARAVLYGRDITRDEALGGRRPQKEAGS